MADAALHAQVRIKSGVDLTIADYNLLRDHADDLPRFLGEDPKGRMLPEYLQQLDGALQAEQRELQDEVGQMFKSLDHLKDIVATQQSYAGSAQLVAPVRVDELVGDALRDILDPRQRGS